MSDTDLEQIENSGFEPPKPDEVAEQESEQIAKEPDRELTRQTLRLKNQALEQGLKLREEFAWRIFLLIVVWLISILVLLLLEGFSPAIFAHKFLLSDNVVLALIGGTTINVLGIFVIVVRYLFPTSSSGSI